LAIAVSVREREHSRLKGALQVSRRYWVEERMGEQERVRMNG